jgi:CheY-like chemotaxis protein
MENQAKKRILYAEDEDVVFIMTERILKNKEVLATYGIKIDCELVRAKTLEEAVKLSDTQTFDLFLSDGNYPYGNLPNDAKCAGLKFYEHVKDKKKPFLLISGKIENIEDALKLGIPCMSKPYNLSEFVEYLKYNLKN